MPDVVFRGPGHVLVAFGQTVKRGQVAVFTDQEVRELLMHPRIDIEVGRMRPAIEPERPSPKASRRQWVGYAAQFGITATDDMSRDDIVAAVDEVEPAAEDGEGQHASHDKEE